MYEKVVMFREKKLASPKNAFVEIAQKNSFNLVNLFS